MPKISTTETVHELLQQGYDPEWHRTLYRQMCYAFGDAWDKVDSPSSTRGKLLECPDITVKYLEVGQSRRILNSSFLGMSRAMYTLPEPEFPDLLPHDGNVLQRFLMKRSEGDGYADGEWQTDDAFAFMDGDGLGFGGVQIILTTDRESGFQKVGTQHIPATHVIYDRHERNPGRASWMAFVHHLAPWDAEARYGVKKCGQYIRPMFDISQGEGQGQAIESMRVIELYTVGLGKDGPSRFVLALDLDGDVLEDEENKLGCIPFAHYTHFVAPGMRRPVGHIALSMATAEAQNEVERYMRNAMLKPTMDFVADGQVDDEDVQDYLEGNTTHPIKFSPTPGTQPWVRIPAEEAAMTAIKWKEMLDNQFNNDTGQTEMDQSRSDFAPTLGQDQMLDARSAPAKNWSTLQTILFHRRKYAKVLKVAALFDRDPVTLPIDTDQGIVQITFNDESDPRMGIDRWASKPGRIVISQESIEGHDAKTEKASKLAGLASLVDLVEMGKVSGDWWRDQRLKALGYDPNEAAPTPQEMQAAQMAQMQQGMPGQPSGMPPAA